MLLQHKSLAEAALLPAIVVLVGLSAFGLGRLSVASVPPAQTAAAYQAAGESAPTPAPAFAQPKTVSASEGQFVASKNGTKYYLPSCSGVSKIKEENKVYFASAADAQAAGYSAAANCPGL
jgi:hypothetical protein